MKKQFVKVLSLVMALMMVVGAFGTMTFAAEHVHTKGTKGATVAPTCYGNGFTWYTCADASCGEQYMDDVVEKLAHVFTTATKAADCTTAAFTYSKCTNAGCGLADGKGTDSNPTGSAWLDQKFVEGSKALGHNYSVVYTAPTCEKNAKSEYKCTRCNKTAADNGDTTKYPTVEHANTKLVHDYKYTLVSAASGCIDGVMTGVCGNCNKNINITVAAPHKYVNDTAHDCNNIASGIVCLDCGKVALQGTLVYLWNASTKRYEDAAVTAPAVTYEDEDYDATHTYDASQISMLEVQNMGYTSAYKAATCVANGWSINFCTKCQKHVVTVLEATGEHAWTQTGKDTLTINESATGTTCHSAVVVKYECSCGAKKSETIREATAHTLYEEVVDATCTSEGLVNTYCKYCTKFDANGAYTKGYKSTRYTTAKLGHDWKADGDPVGTDCTTGIKQNYKCDRDDCTVTKYEWVVEVGECNFTNSWKSYVATCAEPAYRLPMCKVCGLVDETATKNYTGTLKDENNHVVPAVSSMVVNKAPTCTATGTNYYTCANPDCGKQGLSYTVKALGHAKSKAISIEVDGQTKNAPKYNNKTLTAADIKDATCNAEGLKMGEWCTRCNTWLTQPSVIAKKPKKHTQTGVVIETVSVKTCSTDHVVKVSYACCSTVVEELGAQGNAAGICSEDATWIKTKAAKIDKVSCTVGGNHEYKYCPGCGWVYEVVTAGCTCGMTAAQHAEASDTLNPSIPGLGHKWVERDGHVETCTDAGWTDYKECSECHVTQGYKVIPAHNKDFWVGNSGIKETKPTCTKPGVSYDTNTDHGQTVKNVCSKCAKREIAPLAHSWTKKTDIMNAVVGVANDCTSASFEVYTCTKGCGQFRIYDRSYQAGEAAHDWNAMWNEYTVKNGEIYLNGKKLDEYTIANGKVTLDGVVVDTYADGESFEYCGFVARKFKTCANVGCTKELIEDQQAPASHYYIVDGAMTDIDLNCKKVSAFYGVTCAGCNKEVVATAASGKLSAVHSFKYAEKAPTCTANGYQITACVDCGAYDKINGADFNIVIPKIGHVGENALLLEHVEPTGSKDGYKKFKCLREGCGETYTVVLEAADVTFSFTAENTLVPGSIVVNSGMVSLVVKTSAAKVGVNTIGLEIGYDMRVLEFVDATVLNSLFTNRAFAGAENGIVTVAISAPNSAAGKIQDVVLDGDNVALVKLNFKVVDNAIVEGEALDGNAAYGETTFWCKSAEVYNKDGKSAESQNPENVISVGVNGEAVNNPVTGLYLASDTEKSYGVMYSIDNVGSFEYAGDYSAAKVWGVATVKYYAIGDVNLDGPVAGNKNKVATLDDAIALVKIWNNESELGKYSAAADIDKDGAITVADYEFLMMYITGEISYAALLNKGVEPEEADEKMEITVGPNGEIIIKPVA